MSSESIPADVEHAESQSAGHAQKRARARQVICCKSTTAGKVSCNEFLASRVLRRVE